MSRIRPLSDLAIAQIAAGEVIERPASAVREMIDNSLDAGAKRLAVRLVFTDGDLEVTVEDDGEGMDAEDLPLAFARHATSKIRSADDIWGAGTLGFRGEALASIASVSEVECLSSPDGSGKGHRLRIEGGKSSPIEGIPFGRGTTMKVRRFFFNAPVRREFLKSPLSERNEIRRELALRAFIRPDVAFVFTSEMNGKKDEWLFPVPRSRTAAVEKAFGSELASLLLPVSCVRGGLRLEGFVSSPAHHGKTRKDQFFFVRNRPVQHASLSAALVHACQNLLPGRAHSACFLSIELPEGEVDVNVHPQKKEVRFKDADEAYRLVFHGVREVLSKALSVSGHTEGEKPGPAWFASSIRSASVSPSTSPPSEPGLAEPSFPFAATARGEFLSSEGVSRPFPSDATTHEKKGEGRISSDLATEEPPLVPDIRILGQVGRLYVVFSIGDELYVADQHALHERIHFDRLSAKFAARRFVQQPLLVPLLLDKGRLFRDRVEEAREVLEGFGLKPEPFGEDAVQFTELPDWVPAEREGSVVGAVLDEVLRNRNRSLVEIRERTLATAACRMSVMAGDELGAEAMKGLIESAYRGRHPFRCPHGRPAVRRWSFDELHRLFGRTEKFHDEAGGD